MAAYNSFSMNHKYPQKNRVSVIPEGPFRSSFVCHFDVLKQHTPRKPQGMLPSQK
jgi:hypothetical protein